MIRNRYLLLLDFPMIAIAAFGAFALRFDFEFTRYRAEFIPFVAAAVTLKPLLFFPFGMYARYWRYGTASDLVAIAMAVTAGSVALAVFVGGALMLGLIPEFARPIIMIDWLLTLALVGGVRLSIRIVADARQTSQKGTPSRTRQVLIVGAGEAGNMVAREMIRNPHLGLVPVGFLDDSRVKWQKQILGIPVFGPIAALETIVPQRRINEVVIAMPTASGEAIRNATEACRRVGISPRVVPGVFELLDGQVSVSRLRRVEIADLLRRPQITGHLNRMSYLEGRTVLITGAGGSIGSELSRQVAFSKPKSLILVGHGENSIFAVHQFLVEHYPGLDLHPVIADVRNRDRMDRVIAATKPDVVFHAAAHKHVPLMEVNPEEAFTNNLAGTKNVVDVCEARGVGRLVLISTDKAVDPTSLMGASKRLAESVVVGAGRRTGRPYVVVRFGNVLGSRGSVVPKLQAQIEQGGPVTVTHPEMKRFFMTIPEAAHLVLQAGGIGQPGDLFVLNMGEQLKVLDLAKDLIRLSGADPETILIQYTGIRAGEKLEEALWEEGSAIELTDNPDVLRVREPSARDTGDTRHDIDDVIAAAIGGDVERLRRSLHVALPTYVADPSLGKQAQGGLSPL